MYLRFWCFTSYVFLDSLSFVYVSPSLFIPIMTADVTLILLIGVGYVVTPHLSPSNVYFILKLTLNLASVGQLCDSSDSLIIVSSFFFVHDLESQKLIGIGRKKKRLYILDELKM